MNYTKPEITVLDNAVRAVRRQVKNSLSNVDFGGPIGMTLWNDQPAYEADE